MAGVPPRTALGEDYSAPQTPSLTKERGREEWKGVGKEKEGVEEEQEGGKGEGRGGPEKGRGKAGEGVQTKRRDGKGEVNERIMG